MADDPAELARAVDADALLLEVCAAMALTPEATALVLEALSRQPCVIEHRAGVDIDDAIQRVNGGLCGDRHLGVTLSDRRIWVMRLGWRPLVGHELTHVVTRLLGRPNDEALARRVADQVG